MDFLTFLKSLSFEQLIHRQEQRFRCLELAIGDADVHLLEMTAIRMEMEQRIDERRPIS